MDPDNAPGLTIPMIVSDGPWPTPRKPRTTGKLVWLSVHPGDGALLEIESQPEHPDIAAASKWLTEQVATDALPAGETYALHRAICTATPRLEVTKKAVLL